MTTNLWFKTMHAYSLIVLKARSPKSGALTKIKTSGLYSFCSPSKGKIHFLVFPVSKTGFLTLLGSWPLRSQQCGYLLLFYKDPCDCF